VVPAHERSFAEELVRDMDEPEAGPQPQDAEGTGAKAETFKGVVAAPVVRWPGVAVSGSALAAKRRPPSQPELDFSFSGNVSFVPDGQTHRTGEW
jgi:hypothetical protein